VAEAAEVAAVEVGLAVVVEEVPVVAVAVSVLILRESRVSTRQLIIAAADVPE